VDTGAFKESRNRKTTGRDKIMFNCLNTINFFVSYVLTFFKIMLEIKKYFTNVDRSVAII
jgi:hypothetical protein